MPFFRRVAVMCKLQIIIQYISVYGGNCSGETMMYIRVYIDVQTGCFDSEIVRIRTHQ